MVSELFFAKFLEFLTTGSLEIGKFVQKQSVSIFEKKFEKNSKDRAGTEQIKWSLYLRHVCFCNPCERAESHQQERMQ